MPLSRPPLHASTRPHAVPDEQRTRIEALTAALARDHLTQLINRGGLIDSLRHAMQSLDPDFGHVLVFRQRDLSEINRQMPRELTDQWLRTTALRLTELLSAFPGASGFLLARLNGSDFALLMPGVDSPHAVVWAERVREVLLQARVPVGDGELCRWALGLVHYTHGDNVADLLASLDHTLMRSESAIPDCLIVGDGTSLDVATGEFAWHDTLITALDQNRFFLRADEQHDIHGRLVRQDAVLMLQTEAGAPPVPPHIFIPAAVRLGLSAQCDIQAVRLGLDWLVSHSGTLSVRLSIPTLTQDDFLPRLQTLLEARPELVPRLLLEIDAHAITAFYPKVRALNEMLTTAGVKMAVRRLSEQLSAITQLHTLKLAYVRLGGPFVRGLCQSPGGRELAMSVASTARALHIDVHAEDVPDRACAELLEVMGMHVMRGLGANTRKPQAVSKGQPSQGQASHSEQTLHPQHASHSEQTMHAQHASHSEHPSQSQQAMSSPVPEPDGSKRLPSGLHPLEKPAHAASPLRSPSAGPAPANRLPGHALAQRVEDALTNLSAERSLQRESGVMMSHELRTPLSTISAAAQSLELILAGSGEMIDGRIARIRRAVARMSELLDTFFNAQRDDSGALTPLLADVDMVALADQVLTELRPDTAHQLVLSADGPAFARCDASLTAVVLRNLLHNAVKYSPANEPITVRIEAHESDAGVQCIMSIVDRGMGMTAEELGKIFDPQYRRPAHGEVKGTGIGLSIARKLCEIQDGRLEAHSAPAAGTRLNILLPGLRTPDATPPG